MDFGLGYPDSNQKRQDQNLQCYHYTIPQYSMTSYNLDVCFQMISELRVQSYGLFLKLPNFFAIFFRFEPKFLLYYLKKHKKEGQMHYF